MSCTDTQGKFQRARVFITRKLPREPFCMVLAPMGLGIKGPCMPKAAVPKPNRQHQANSRALPEQKLSKSIEVPSPGLPFVRGAGGDIHVTVGDPVGDELFLVFLQAF